MIWIGCPNMDNEQVYQSIPGNLTFLQGCAASLVGQSLLIDTKALEAATHHGPGFRIHDAGHGVRIRAARSSAHCRCCGGAAAPPQVRGARHENKTAHF